MARRAHRRPAGRLIPTHLLKYASYDEFCEEVALERLVASGRDAITRLAPARGMRPGPPLDLGGVMGAEPPERRSMRSTLADSWWWLPFRSPQLHAACLHDAVAYGGKVFPTSLRWHEGGQLLVAADRYLVDDSYHRRDRRRTLPSTLLRPAGGGALALDADLGALPRHAGDHYLLGGLYGHFGHFLLEGLSRSWLLERLAGEDLTFVVYEPDPIPAWVLALLEGLGVRAEHILVLREPARFERLIVPSRALVLHREAAGVMGRVWGRIGDHFAAAGPAEDLYLSRSRFKQRRALVDEVAVEALFAERGFRVVHPETLPIAEQVAMARRAPRIAGSAGSNMYLGMFQARGARKLIITPRNFTFRDDQLISHVGGGQLAYFVTADEAPGPPRFADYRVDLEQLGAAIDTWLAG